jgi:hypothetical protein
MPSINIIMLQTVANGLKELKEEVVFVGGAVAELYASDPAASDIRPTQDVDCVIELSSRIEHNRLEKNLRSKEFTNDTSPGAPICRWVFNDIRVDVMPTDYKILGFSNRWYAQGIENKIVKTLVDDTEIFVFPPEYYLASKLEAHNDRGDIDLRQSHDFEDIIYIFENCPTILEDIGNSNPKVKAYLKEACQNLLENENLKEGIESALPFGSDSDMTEIIEDIIGSIAEIK